MAGTFPYPLQAGGSPERTIQLSAEDLVPVELTSPSSQEHRLAPGEPLGLRAGGASQPLISAGMSAVRRAAAALVLRMRVAFARALPLLSAAATACIAGGRWLLAHAGKSLRSARLWHLGRTSASAGWRGQLLLTREPGPADDGLLRELQQALADHAQGRAAEGRKILIAETGGRVALVLESPALEAQRLPAERTLLGRPALPPPR